MFNLGDMMGKVKEMQQRIQEAREELDSITVQAEAGAGLVRVTATASRRITGIELDPSIISTDDTEMLTDLVIAAVNKALDEAEEKGREKIQSATQGMMPNIPGLSDMGGSIGY